MDAVGPTFQGNHLGLRGEAWTPTLSHSPSWSGSNVVLVGDGSSGQKAGTKWVHLAPISMILGPVFSRPMFPGWWPGLNERPGLEWNSPLAQPIGGSEWCWCLRRRSDLEMATACHCMCLFRNEAHDDRCKLICMSVCPKKAVAKPKTAPKFLPKLRSQKRKNASLKASESSARAKTRVVHRVGALFFF